MWKKEEGMAKPAGAPVTPGTSSSPMTKEVRPMEVPKTMESFRSDLAHIGKSVVIKGELSGSEDLYLDGEVEGSVELRDHSLTIGPNGRVRANVHAKDVVIHGKVDGNVHGADRVELKRSAVLTGDIQTQRVVIEDGAFFKGAVDIKKEGKDGKAEKGMAAAASYGGSHASYNAASAQSSLLDKK